MVGKDPAEAEGMDSSDCKEQTYVSPGGRGFFFCLFIGYMWK